MNESQKQEPSFGQGLEMAQLAIKAIVNAKKISGITDEQLQKGIIGDPGEVYDYFLELFKKNSLRVLNTGCLEFLGTIKVKTFSGEKAIAGSVEVFRSRLKALVNSGLPLNIVKASNSEVDIYQMYTGTSFNEWYESFGRPLDSLVLEYEQAINICLDNREKLIGDGYHNLFLVKTDCLKPATRDNLSVVAIRIISNKFLLDDSYKFDCPYSWRDKWGRLFVPTKLLPS